MARAILRFIALLLIGWHRQFDRDTTRSVFEGRPLFISFEISWHLTHRMFCLIEGLV